LMYRILGIAARFFWITYSICLLNIAGIVLESALSVAVIIGLIRFLKTK
jgi:hypothetical protein